MRTFVALEAGWKVALVIGMFPTRRQAEAHAAWWETEVKRTINPNPCYIYIALSWTEANRQYELRV
mgnify:FL=1